MKPSPELFELVQSLTKSEKRFFKLSSSLQAGEKNYLRIFEAIDKQNEYDEEGIKAQFSDETFVKHFPSEKNHLYKLILKSLRAYHADDSVSSQLKQEIKNIEILYKKALYKECNKFLGRAKRMAIAYEKFYYHFELLNWEKLLLEEAYEAGEFTTDLEALILEEQDIVEKLRNLAAYQILYSKINYLFRSGGYVRTDEERMLVNEISNHPLIKGKNTALSNRAATICYYIQGYCAQANLDKSLAFEKFQKVKAILDRHPLIREDLQKRYVRTLNNLVNVMIDLGMIEESQKMISELKGITKVKGFTSENIHLMVFKSGYLAELKLLEKMGQFQEACKLMDEIAKGLTDYGEKINKEQEILFFYSMARINFGAGEFNKSLFWLNKVINDNETHLRQDIYSYARLFNLVVHYELGNYDLLEYITKSAHRYLNRHQRDYDLELVIVNYMKKLARSEKGQTPRKIFTDFKQEIDKQLLHEQNQVILEYFNYPLWLESKVRGMSFEQAAQELQKEVA